MVILKRWLCILLIVLPSGCGHAPSDSGVAVQKPSPEQGPVGAKQPFPPGFLWGVSTAGHQMEGGDRSSNWALWEATGHATEPSGHGVESYERFEEDLDLAKGMGLGAYRLSLEWARIEPRRGVTDPKAIAHYHAVIRGAIARGLVPILTLHHFSYPSWLDELHEDGPGGWESIETLWEFKRFAAWAAREYAPEVRYWITLNEPNTQAVCGYLLGIFPPGKRNPLAYSQVLIRLKQAHRLAYAELHAVRRDAMVSVNPFIFRKHDARYQIQAMNPDETAILDDANRGKALDYVAFDYYYPTSPGDWPHLKHAWTWPVYPEGLYATSKELYERYKLPLLIAENGMASQGDRPRTDGWTRSAFIVNHLAQLRRAMVEGVPVLGYMHWSLVDNYEWGSFEPRFGLFAIDRRDPTLRRIRTEAVETYSAIARANGLPSDFLGRYLGRRY